MKKQSGRQAKRKLYSNNQTKYKIKFKCTSDIQRARDEEVGEVPVAFVTRRPGANVYESSIIDFNEKAEDGLKDKVEYTVGYYCNKTDYVMIPHQPTEVCPDEEYKSKRWVFESHNLTLSVICSLFLTKAEILEDNDGHSSALINNKVSLPFTESPTNSFLRCVDIELVSKLCHAHGAVVSIYGTFATPLN
nr:cystathionine gamma-synthase 1, chloroplastic-like [Tanacetum cinerariifolium]